MCLGSKFLEYFVTAPLQLNIWIWPLTPDFEQSSAYEQDAVPQPALYVGYAKPCTLFEFGMPNSVMHRLWYAADLFAALALKGSFNLINDNCITRAFA